MLNNEPSVFWFRDPIEYLNFALKSRQQREQGYSLRAWARELGYENPSYLSHILKRNRKLKMNVAHRLAKNLDLTGKEKQYFELLAMEHTSESESERQLFQKMIQRLTKNEAAALDEQPLEKFELATEWYHWVIVEMFYLKGFEFNVDNVSARIGVPKKKVAEAVKRLTALGFIKKSADGRYERATDTPVYWPNLPQWALHAMHHSTIDQVKKAIDGFSPKMRNLRVTRMALSWENYAKAVEIITEAHKKIMALPTDGNQADEVFQFCSQIHPVTMSPKAVRYDETTH